MTNRPAWPEAARDLTAFRGRRDLGLHLNLTAGAPCGPMPRFAPRGAFPPIGEVVKQSLLRRLPVEEIRAEIARQIDGFAAEMGAPPDFVDGHQHVHILPGVRRWLIEDLARRGWAGTVWLRDSSDQPAAICARRVEAVKALQVYALGRGFRQEAAQAGFATNIGFSGFSSFDAGRSFATDFSAFLTRPGPRHLIMCHPGHPDAALAEIDDVSQTRSQELAFLMSDAFPALMAAGHAILSCWNGSILTGP